MCYAKNAEDAKKECHARDENDAKKNCRAKNAKTAKKKVAQMQPCALLHCGVHGLYRIERKFAAQALLKDIFFIAVYADMSESIIHIT